jgi:hypothetical protein
MFSPVLASVILLVSLLFDSVPADLGVPILGVAFTYCTVELDRLGYWTIAIILLFFLLSTGEFNSIIGL